MKTFAVAFLLGIGTAGTALAAQDTKVDTPQVNAAPAVRHFDFEDDQVEGDLQRPDGELVSAMPKASQKSLIEIPRSFLPELIKTFEDL